MEKMIMKLDMTEFLFGMSSALDALEVEFLGRATGHGERVAWMTMKMMQASGADEQLIRDITLLALLHDNGLAPYYRHYAEKKKGKDTSLNRLLMKAETGNGAEHCILGEEAVKLLPFQSNVNNVILYHHENADGTGLLKVKAEDTPLGARVIHLADMADVCCNVQDPEKYDMVLSFVRQRKGKWFCEDTVSLFEQSLTEDAFHDMQTRGAETLLREGLHSQARDFTDAEIRSLAGFFARIVDYKSSLTKDHSLGVAAKAERMARFYGWNEEKVIRYYLAGALHDVGKMFVDNDILEKPDRLTSEEFTKMQNHAAWTHAVLSRIPGLEDVDRWASRHHEKLDGTGYCEGLKAEDLSMEDRLMGCIDIYQALTEKRPYKEGLSHAKAAGIMRSMAKDGKIDAGITEDLLSVYGDDAEESSGTETHEGKKWKCPVCGYVYEGDNPPESCPVCHAPGYRFEPVN